jgi:N-acetylmuramoyl-L-alanine amidase
MPYQFGNQSVQLSKEPRNLNGPVYAPLREVIEQLGGKITWDNASKTAGATLKGRHARIPNDSNTFEVDGQQVNMSVPTLFLEEEVWVPIEFFGLAFGVPAYAEAGNLVRLNTDSLAMAA